MTARVFLPPREQRRSSLIGRVVMKKLPLLLIGGFYLPASEIERRLQICSSNFYADPGKPPKSRWCLHSIYAIGLTSNDLTPPPSDAAHGEAAIKQSTPLNSHRKYGRPHEMRVDVCDE